MERFEKLLNAAHFMLHPHEKDVVLNGAVALIELAETLPESTDALPVGTSVSVTQLRVDEAIPSNEKPEQIAPATQDGFIRVPRVLD